MSALVLSLSCNMEGLEGKQHRKEVIQVKVSLGRSLHRLLDRLGIGLVKAGKGWRIVDVRHPGGWTRETVLARVR